MVRLNTKTLALPPPQCEWLLKISLKVITALSLLFLLVLLFPPPPSLPSGMEETREIREKFGLMVHYNVKVRCVVSFGTYVNQN